MARSALSHSRFHLNFALRDGTSASGPGDFTCFGSGASRFRKSGGTSHYVMHVGGRRIAMSTLAETLADMQEAQQRARYERWKRDRVDSAIHALDRLVDAIEHLNLKDRARVPMAWQRSLAELACEIPVECGDRLRAGISPTRLLDQVYEIQQELFLLKQGGEADELRRVDGELEGYPLS
jgi:hypothetical protein